MNKKFFISLGSFLAIVLLAIFVIWPLFSSVLELNKEVKERQKELSDLEKLIAKTQELSEDYQLMNSEINKFFLALPDKKEIPQLLIQFENLAVNNGLLFEAIQFVSEQEKDLGFGLTGSQENQDLKTKAFNSSSVNLTVSGSYQAFKGYLSDLEKNIRVMDVKSINFGQEGEANESLNLEIFKYELALDVYYAN